MLYRQSSGNIEFRLANLTSPWVAKLDEERVRTESYRRYTLLPLDVALREKPTSPVVLLSLVRSPSTISYIQPDLLKAAPSNIP